MLRTADNYISILRIASPTEKRPPTAGPLHQINCWLFVADVVGGLTEATTAQIKPALEHGRTITYSNSSVVMNPRT